MRKMIRNLFKLLTKIYPASKLFNYVMEGITSKNSKTRMGRLPRLCFLFQFCYKSYFAEIKDVVISKPVINGMSKER